MSTQTGSLHKSILSQDLQGFIDTPAELSSVCKVYHKFRLWKLQQHAGNLLCQIRAGRNGLHEHEKLLTVKLPLHFRWAVERLGDLKCGRETLGIDCLASVHDRRHVLCLSLSLPLHLSLDAFTFAFGGRALSAPALLRTRHFAWRKCSLEVQGTTQKVFQGGHLYNVYQEVTRRFAWRSEAVRRHPLEGLDLLGPPLRSRRCDDEIIRLPLLPASSRKSLREVSKCILWNLHNVQSELAQCIPQAETSTQILPQRFALSGSNRLAAGFKENADCRCSR
mmetsp:Transcript_56155/g.149878  ORF Transcript_56155/g.149878 Transcript_56155/m.149878 type:complete len:279 (+) Transcript_56155:88-924(+)